MKNSSIENRFCMSLVAFAVIVRLLLATGAAAAVDEAFGRAPQAQERYFMVVPVNSRRSTVHVLLQSPGEADGWLLGQLEQARNER